ncbi:MAG: hypothetical protein AB1758_16695, partial [Candidatus Eremiobacterota bacterium]
MMITAMNPTTPRSRELVEQERATHADKADYYTACIASYESRRGAVTSEVEEFRRAQQPVVGGVLVVTALGFGLGVVGTMISPPLGLLGVATVGGCLYAAYRLREDDRMVTQKAEEVLSDINRNLEELRG